MYENTKMIAAETVLEWGKRGLRKAVEMVNLYLTYFKNLCKCYNVPTPSTTIRKKL
jgi:hypothetical protein